MSEREPESLTEEALQEQAGRDPWPGKVREALLDLFRQYEDQIPWRDDD